MNDALLSILEEKPFEYITVSEICKKAGVNRSTFYLHYENTTDLLAETTKRLFDDFLSYFPIEVKAIAVRLADCELTKLNFISAEYLHPYLSYIKNNKTIFLTALTHADSFGFDRVFQRLFQNIFDLILDRFGYHVEDRKYVMMFYLNGINAIIVEWLKDGCNKSIEEISRIIYECIFGLDV